MNAPTARSCAHCEELREEIRFLKRERDLQRIQDQVTCLKVHFGLSPAEAHILSVLYAASGRVLSNVQIDDMTPAPVVGEDRQLKHVDVRICRIRKKLGAAAIQNVWGRGHFLTDIGRLQVEEALEGQKARAA